METIQELKDIPSFAASAQDERSVLLFVPCRFCIVQHAKGIIPRVERAFKLLGKRNTVMNKLILSNRPQPDKAKSRVCCDNGHIYIVDNSEFHKQR